MELYRASRRDVSGGSGPCGLLFCVGVFAFVRMSSLPFGRPGPVEKISRNGERYSPDWDSDASSNSSCTSGVR